MKPLEGMKVAVLVANGFEEKSFLKAQKMMIDMGATMRLISTNQGLVNGWDDNAWGHNYAIDAQLNTALGVDYNALIIPGGARSLDKLKLTAHTRRFVSSFMAAQKPVAVMGDAIAMMANIEQIMDFTVAGPAASQSDVERSGAHWSEEVVTIDRNILSGDVEADEDAYFAAMQELFTSMNADMEQAA